MCVFITTVPIIKLFAWGGSHSRPGPSDKGKGSVTRPHVSSPAVLRPRCAPKFFRPSDPVPMRVFYKKHFENIGHEVPCEWDCTMPNCLNRVRTEFVRVGPSNLLRGLRVTSVLTRCHDDDDVMMMSFICSCRNKNQPKTIYPKGTSHHTRLFRGPSTNDMKK
jgi:hypothetical protein